MSATNVPCTKLEIYAQSGKENEYYLEDNLRCEVTSSMTLNNATLFWHLAKMFNKTSTTPLPTEGVILFLVRDIGRLT